MLYDVKMGQLRECTPQDLDCTTQSEEAIGGLQKAAPRLIPALTVLYHRDWRQIGRRALLHEIPAGQEVALSRTSPR